jgi:class 3 adenylate cyclase
VALQDDLKGEVARIFRENWQKRDGTTVPDTDDLPLANDAVLLEGTVLYADLAQSTRMVDSEKPHFAAEVYKAYLYCAARCITQEGGVVTAYDGDRVMAVFIGEVKNTPAVRSALKIHTAVRNIINPAINNQYPASTFVVRHVVGVDTSKLWVTRTGVRGANDLVWVGRAANYAAKLTELDSAHPTWITKAVFDGMRDSVKLTNGKSMWEARRWTAMGDLAVYRSNWWWGTV